MFSPFPVPFSTPTTPVPISFLKSGAALATEAADILLALNIDMEAKNPAREKKITETDGEEGAVLREIQTAAFAVGIDKISENTKLQPPSGEPRRHFPDAEGFNKRKRRRLCRQIIKTKETKSRNLL